MSTPGSISRDINVINYIKGWDIIVHIVSKETQFDIFKASNELVIISFALLMTNENSLWPMRNWNRYLHFCILRRV